MTPYRGIINIICTRKKGPSASSSGPRGCLRNLKVSDVQPGCMDCPEAISQILDLDGKVIYEYKEMPQRPKVPPASPKAKPMAGRHQEEKII